MQNHPLIWEICHCVGYFRNNREPLNTVITTSRGHHLMPVMYVHVFIIKGTPFSQHDTDCVNQQIWAKNCCHDSNIIKERSSL